MAVGTLVAGCSDDPGSLTGGRNPYASRESGDPDTDDDEELPPAATPAPAPPRDVSFGERTLARARQWIAAEMPYCGGPNGGKDLICGGTCTRSGAAKSAEWDKYRSDCSGFVSWSWGLAAPGQTTRSLAPYDTAVSVVIPVDDLAPGDALNGAGHVMLFGGWSDEAAGKAVILQESRCGTVASEKISTFTKVDATTLKISDGRVFRAIRLKGAPSP
ncbi:MAG: hypothetical protein JST00_39930 [Deltaproteobacteria bacterium]|nr:hypothetical protein [Deltaproteobacteria bacterium]